MLDSLILPPPSPQRLHEHTYYKPLFSTCIATCISLDVYQSFDSRFVIVANRLHGLRVGKIVDKHSK